MLKLVGLTAAAIFTAEALVMLFIEAWGERLSLPMRVLLDATLLMVCVFPTLYLLVFKEMAEQIRLRSQAEEAQAAWNQSLEVMVEERTGRLQRANEDLLIEVQERAKAAMALRSALNEARRGKEQLRAFINAVPDALLVIDGEWRILVVNQAAEALLSANAYDLLGKSLKAMLLSWTARPTDLERFFSEQSGLSPWLAKPHAERDPCPVQMQFGKELEWDGHTAKVLMIYKSQARVADATATDNPTG